MDAILSLREVSRDFITRRRVVEAMAGLSLDIRAGEFLTVVGPSGCGKSPLLNIVSDLPPSSSRGGGYIWRIGSRQDMRTGNPLTWLRAGINHDLTFAARQIPATLTTPG